MGPSNHFEGVHSTLEIHRPRDGVLVIRITGTDIGELQDAPFKALEPDLTGDRSLELFVDSRETRGASISVSNDWALFLRKHRERFHRVTMLPGSRFIQVTADFVRRFADLGDRMYITTDPAAFDAALDEAVRT